MDALSTFSSIFSGACGYLTSDFLNDACAYVTNEFTEFHGHLTSFCGYVTGLLSSFGVPHPHLLSCFLAVMVFSIFVFVISRVLEWLAGIVGFILGSFRQFLVAFSACYVAILVHGNHERVMELIMQGI